MLVFMMTFFPLGLYMDTFYIYWNRERERENNLTPRMTIIIISWNEYNLLNSLSGCRSSILISSTTGFLANSSNSRALFSFFKIILIKSLLF
jgi:hypothetical protein